MVENSKVVTGKNNQNEKIFEIRNRNEGGGNNIFGSNNNNDNSRDNANTFTRNKIPILPQSYENKRNRNNEALDRRRIAKERIN